MRRHLKGGFPGIKKERIIDDDGKLIGIMMYASA